MTPLELALAVVVGFAGGVAGGLFGVGGGVVVVPLLLLAVPGTSFKEAKAASLVLVGLAALTAALAHRRRGSVDARAGLFLGAGGVLGAALAAALAERLTDRTLAALFGVALVLVGLRFAAGVEPRPRTTGPRARAALAAGTGLAAGFLAGLFGIGGGVLMVPALVAAGYGMHLAVGTSLVAVAANGVAGTLAHAALGYGPVLATLGLAVALGGVPGGELGARLAHRLPAKRLQRAFGAFLAAVGVWITSMAL